MEQIMYFLIQINTFKRKYISMIKKMPFYYEEIDTLIKKQLKAEKEVKYSKLWYDFDVKERKKILKDV